MRLSAEEAATIASLSRAIFPCDFSLYLIGSRTDKLQKGGDIDILLIVKPQDEKVVFLEKFKFLGALKSKIGDQKIDLTITSDRKLPFIVEVMPTAILLVEAKYSG